jgi:hypothetical protein
VYTGENRLGADSERSISIWRWVHRERVELALRLRLSAFRFAAHSEAPEPGSGLEAPAPPGGGTWGLWPARSARAGSKLRSAPVAWREKLQGRMHAQHLFSLSMTAELFRILETFSKCKIEALLIKGPIVSLLAYGDPALRGYVDLDLLVRHDDILAATQKMIALGFEAKIPLAAIQAGKIPGEYLFRRPGTQRIIELHTERSFRCYPRPLPLKDLCARQRTVALDGKGVPALSLEDEFVLNCIHGAKHFWERLMWVADIAAIVVRHPELDWLRARQAALEVGAARMLYLALLLAQNLLGAPVPVPLAMDVAQGSRIPKLSDQVVRWLPQAGSAPPSLWQRAAFRMSMPDGGLASAAYLLRLSLSPTDEDWQHGAEDVRSWLWDALRRPLRLIRKYSSGN